MAVFQADACLLEAFRRGEQWALRRVYLHYAADVASALRFGIGRSALQSADVADVVQETFAKAFSAPARLAFDGVRLYRPFLLTLARNVLTDRFRRRTRLVPCDNETLTALLETQVSSDEAAPWQQERLMEEVASAVERLPAELAELCRLRFAHGLSQAAAGQSMGKTRQHIRTLEAQLFDVLRSHTAMSDCA